MLILLCVNGLICPEESDLDPGSVHSAANREVPVHYIIKSLLLIPLQEYEIIPGYWLQVVRAVIIIIFCSAFPSLYLWYLWAMHHKGQSILPISDLFALISKKIKWEIIK